MERLETAASRGQRIGAIQALAWALPIISFLLLLFGNISVREVSGVDLTPFEAAGPPFFVIVIPLSLLLMHSQFWHAAVIVTILHASALVALMQHFLGWRAAGVAITSYILGGVVAWGIARVLRVEEHSGHAG